MQSSVKLPQPYQHSNTVQSTTDFSQLFRISIVTRQVLIITVTIMSRRRRTQLRRQPIQMGLNHHSQYSSSETHFPRSYSILGSPIAIPAKILPLHHKQHINYVKESNLTEHDTYLLENIPLSQVHSATQINLTLQGRIISSSWTYLNKLIFFLSMLCCVLFCLFKLSFIRKLIYTKYLIAEAEYRAIASFVSRLRSCEDLVINFQDNCFDSRKCSIVAEGIAQMIDSQTKETPGNRPTVSVTLRNYCYAMGQDHTYDSELSRLSEKYPNNLKIVFVWENIVKVFGQKHFTECSTDENAELRSLTDHSHIVI